MPKKPRTCNASVAALICKFGLSDVRSAVDMAVALSGETAPKRDSKARGLWAKPKAPVTAAIAPSTD